MKKTPSTEGAPAPATPAPLLPEERQELFCTFSGIIVSYLAEFDLTETARADAHQCYLRVSELIQGSEI